MMSTSMDMSLDKIMISFMSVMSLTKCSYLIWENLLKVKAMMD